MRFSLSRIEGQNEDFLSERCPRYQLELRSLSAPPSTTAVTSAASKSRGSGVSTIYKHSSFYQRIAPIRRDASLAPDPPCPW